MQADYFIQNPPTPGELSDFFTYGWSLMPQLLPPEACADLITATEAAREKADSGVVVETGLLTNAAGAVPQILDVASLPVVLTYLKQQFQIRMKPVETMNFSKAFEAAPITLGGRCASVPSGFACGVLIALEDFTLGEQGGLMVYSGTHAWPELPASWIPGGVEKQAQFMSQLILHRGAMGVPMGLRAGTGLLMASNLLYHWLGATNPARTRHLQLTLYIADGSVRHALDGYQRELPHYVPTSAIDAKSTE